MWEMCPFHPVAGGCLGGQLWAAGNHPAEPCAGKEDQICWKHHRLEPYLGGVAPEKVDAHLMELFPLIILLSGFPSVSRLVLLSCCGTCACCKAKGCLTGKLNLIARSIDIYYKCLSWANNPWIYVDISKPICFGYCYACLGISLCKHSMDWLLL